ncbi:uncharacterized protein LOC110246097 [Exaiptasia diaphana]|uniref:RING-type domain-containing protein n=1 Tax=Exaiptasia diaphana TaxID=2652724 RepID=A0A913XQH6_EXADI|nr:uncharacterized protein LOC110246097 [Exaiptasia diaphana]KXJ25175.1 Tripartite motif containing 13 [Exaiptasia diaphana]
MAACKNFQMELEDSEVCCPLCFDIFEVPKSFPNCAHNVCKSCLSNLIGRKKDVMDIECPVCRQTSPLPSRGVDGFPTNTLIVRLIEKIPGIKEKKEIKHAVRLCKDEIERNTRIRENLERQLAVVNNNKQLGEDLKKQISSHAKECIDVIVKCEEKMHEEVDKYLKEHCGLKFHEQLEKEIEEMTSYLEVAQNCVFNVEDTVNNEDLSEISEMKEVIKVQLDEYSRYPESSVHTSAMNVKSFDMTLKKSDVNDDFLGNLTNDIPQPADQTCSSNTQHGESLVSATCMEVNSGPSEFVIDEYREFESEREVLHCVDLPFYPSRIAVCPQSGDVAVLWKENRKVHLYSSDAVHKATIQIVYGSLSDVGFCSLGNVVVVNRDSNRLLFYDKGGTFKRIKLHVASGNLKYTYFSCNNDVFTVVSSELNEDCEIDSSIMKCVVVYKSNIPTPQKVFGKNQLVKPLSRAVYHNEKIYIADPREGSYGYDIVLKVFHGPEFELAQVVVDSSSITEYIPTDFVSIFRNNNCTLFYTGQTSSVLLFGYPDINHVYAIDGANNNVGIRFTHHAKQQELIETHTLSSSANIGHHDIVQVEISSFRKSFEIVVYHHVE